MAGQSSTSPEAWLARTCPARETVLVRSTQGIGPDDGWHLIHFHWDNSAALGLDTEEVP